MAGQMAWLCPFGGDGTKILHLRQSPTSPWQRYDRLRVAVPEYPSAPGTAQHSKGWATYQALRQQGWELVATAVATRERVGVK